MGHPFLLKNAKLQITTVRWFFFLRNGRKTFNICIFRCTFYAVLSVRWNTKVTLFLRDSAFSSAVYTHFEKGLSLLCFSGKVACHTRVDDDGNDSWKPWLPFLSQSFGFFEWKTFCFGLGFFCLCLSTGEDRMTQFIYQRHARVAKIHSMVIIYTVRTVPSKLMSEFLRHAVILENS